MNFITDTLLVGNIDDARKPPRTVGAMLLVAEEHTIEPAAWLKYKRIPFKEFAEVDPLRLNRAVEWLEHHAPESRTLVCCRAGMGRSVSVVIAYLCCVQGMAYDEALKLAKTRRPGATPLPRLQDTVEAVRQLRALQASKKTNQPHQPKPRCA